ncbi:MAG: ribosomal L7Ae/L30e/S12e/Gadd45 family protein [Oscillospiraceae bacterium]|nr:ribosomal L7Ae/L30e/S12e/Gadd45 family protein [Oscillospiraceae bacterium]
MDKLATLGLCKKAGKLIIGFDAVAEYIKRGGPGLLILTADLSPKSSKEIIRIADAQGFEYLQIGAAMDDIKRLVGKKAGILAIADQGLAKSFAGKVKTQEEDFSV